MAITGYSSPGVYVKEVDKSWYESPKTRSVSVTILGPARNGEINVPTDVETIKDFESKFGKPLCNAGLCAVSCLGVASSVKFVRIADNAASAREAKLNALKLPDAEVDDLLTFTNATAGTIDEATWTMQISYVDGDMSKVNFCFKKDATIVYDSSLDNASPKGSFDPLADDFSTVTLPAIATACGFETPTLASAEFTSLKEGTYTFTAGAEAVKRSVVIDGVKRTTVANALKIAYNNKGTVDDNTWQAIISNSSQTNFDLTIKQGSSTVFTTVGSEEGQLSVDEHSPRYVDLVSIENFTITLDLGQGNNIPNQTVEFTAGNNGWTDNSTGDGSIADPTTDPILQGIETVSDRETVITEIIVAPDLHSKDYLDALVNLADTRKDIVVLLDVPRTATEQQAVELLAHINSSYAASYYPWVEVYNSYDNTNQTVAPTVALLPAMMDEYLTYPRWTAPAGQPRMNLKNLVKYSKVLTQSLRDILYTGGLNPLCNYKNLGNTAMGQKTLLRPNEKGLESSLNRLNVRLLINYIKVNIEIISASYIFTTIDQITMDSWIMDVTKFLDSIKNQRGLYDYKVLMNWNTVTPEMLNNNIMPGIIQVKPTRVAEYIPIDIVILNKDDEFSE